MDDRNKLLKIHGDLQKINIPSDFEDKDLQKLANTIEEGLKMIKSWLVAEAKKRYSNGNSSTNE